MKIAVILGVVILGICCMADNQNVYVQVGGSGDCSTIDNACGSLAQALTVVRPSASSLTIHMEEGEYSGRDNIGLHYPSIPISLHGVGAVFIGNGTNNGFIMSAAFNFSDVTLQQMSYGVSLDEGIQPVEYCSFSRVSFLESEYGFYLGANLIEITDCSSNLTSHITIEKSSTVNIKGGSFNSMLSISSSDITIENTSLLRACSVYSAVTGVVRNSIIGDGTFSVSGSSSNKDNDNWMFDSVTVYSGISVSDCNNITVMNSVINNLSEEQGDLTYHLLHFSSSGDILLQNNTFTGYDINLLMNVKKATSISIRDCDFNMYSPIVIKTYNQKLVEIISCHFVGYSTEILSVDQSILFIEDSSFTGGRQDSENGGAISLSKFEDFVIINSEFTQNTASKGGAIYLGTNGEYYGIDIPSSVSMTDVTFTNNTAGFGSNIACDNSLLVSFNLIGSGNSISTREITSFCSSSTIYPVYAEETAEESPKTIHWWIVPFGTFIILTIAVIVIVAAVMVIKYRKKHQENFDIDLNTDIEDVFA